MLDLSGYQVTSALVVLSLVASATTGVCAWHPLAPIRLTNAGSWPSRQRHCVAEPIRLANAAAPLLLRSQARRKAYRARSAETKGTALFLPVLPTPLRGYCCAVR